MSISRGVIFFLAGSTLSVGVLTAGAFWFGLQGLLLRQRTPARVSPQWTDLGPTPMGEKGFTPQGMTWVGKRLIFANTWKNERSRIYEYDPDGMRILRHFDMPAGAVHTSGLAWDGKHLWGVDYITNRAYCMDLEKSLADGRVAEVGSFDTTLKGTSASAFVPFEGGHVLAISDFMHSRRTIFVKPQDALKAKSAKGHIVFSYRNGGFSQGLEYVNGFLYESENKLGIDVINKIDLALLQAAGNARQATVAQISGPSKGIEDLAWDGKEFLYTSDESTFRFYKTCLAH